MITHPEIKPTDRAAATQINAKTRPNQYSSILKWAGSKALLAPKLTPFVAAHLRRRYIEPFFGSGAVLFHLRPDSAIVGDTNVQLMRTYAAIKNNPRRVYDQLELLAEETRALETSAFCDYYYATRATFPLGDAFRIAAQFIFLNRHCWNGLYRENVSGKFNTPIGSYKKLRPLPTLFELENVARVLQKVSLQQRDFRETLHFAQRGDFAFIDPPYLATSTTARFVEYQAEDFAWAQHVELRGLLHSLDKSGISFLLTSSKTARTEMLYDGFFEKPVVVARAINSIATRRTGYTELLISNRPINI